MKTILLNLVSKIKANLKEYAILALIVLLALFGFKACRKLQQKQDKQASSTVLTPDQKEKIVVDPIKHTIEIVTPTKTTTTYLPDRPTQIIENKDGSITIIDHKFGTEMRPYLGVGGDLEWKARIHTGVDFFYFRKFDAGAGLAFNPVELKDTRVDLNLSYNFYSNTSIAISLDNHKTPVIFLKLRF